MHNIWLNQDILRSILDVYEDYKVDQEAERLRTLAALARTCKALYELAMDDLWSVLDDVSPLVKCMPEKAWAMGHMPLGSGQKIDCLVSATACSESLRAQDT